MEPDPGILGDLFEYAQSLAGLLDSLEGDPTIAASNATVLTAAKSGSIAPVVAGHIVV